MSFGSRRNSSGPTQKRALAQIIILFATVIGLHSYLTTTAKATTVPLQTVTLGWNAVPETDIQGYKVYVGTQSLQYTASYLTGNQLTYPVANLTSGQTYYFAVTAIGYGGLESLYSTELVSTLPLPPVAVADVYSASQNTALVVPASGVLANDSDPQSRPLTAILNAGPSHGSLTLNANGGFTYTPAANYLGADSFTYHANNGRLDSEIVTVSLTVSAPVIGSLANGSFEAGLNGWTSYGNISIESSLSYATSPDSNLVAFNGGDLPANAILSQTIATVAGKTYTLAFDAGVFSYNMNTQKLLVTVVGTGSLLNQTVTLTGPSGGTVLWVPQSYTFVADRSSVTLSFSDQSASTNSIDLLLDSVRVTEVVAPANTPPVALADAYSTNQGTILVVATAGVLANDKDAESNSLTAILDVAPSHGGVTLNASGGFTYTPTAGYSGADSFTYHANDGSLNSNIATVSLKINAPPVALADAYSTNQNIALVVSATGVLANDTDAEASPLTAILNVAPSHGSVTLNVSGGFTYTPTAGYSGADSFTYHANDGSMDSNIATVSLTIQVEAPTIVVNGSFETDYTGWTKTGNQAIESTLPYKATAGSKLVAFNGGDQPANAVLSQTFATVLGKTYTLAFDVGVLSYNKSQQKIQVTVAGKKSLLSKTITLTGLGGGTNLWVPQSFTFVADRTTATLNFRDQSTATIGIDLLLDNIRITGPSLLAATTSVETASIAGSTTLQTNTPQSLAMHEPKLASPSLKVVPGAATMSIAAHAAGTYVLERSDDLITWEFVSELHANAPGALDFQADHKAAKNGKTFYRIGFRAD